MRPALGAGPRLFLKEFTDSTEFERAENPALPVALGDDAVRDGLGDGLRLGMHVQFLVDATDVVSDGIDAYMQAIGSRLVAVTFCQHSQEPDLVRRKIMDDFPGWRRLLKELHYFARYLRRHRRAALMEFSDGFEQLGRRRPLQEVPDSSVAD